MAEADSDLPAHPVRGPHAEIDKLFDALERYWRELGREGSFDAFVSDCDSLPDTSAGQAEYRLRAAVAASVSAQSALYCLKQGLVHEAWQDLSDAMYFLGVVHAPGADRPNDAARFMATLRQRAVG